MRIENIQRQTRGDRVRIEARFVYEDCYLPPVDIYYEAGPPLAEHLEALPEAFVLPGLPIAVWEGERRVQIDGTLDEKLANGLRQASQLLNSWYDRCGNIEIEPTQGLRYSKPESQRRTVALMSGGVDALAMLAENRRRFPLQHPNSIQTVLYAFGFSFLDRPHGNESSFMRARYEAQAKRLEKLGKQIGFDVIRLDTNIRQLHPFRGAFYYAAHSGAFLAPLIASPGYLSNALIGSVGEQGTTQVPHGSHPLLDIQYSTAAVQVSHMQAQVARLDKIRMIADWEPAFNTLQVCHGWWTTSPREANCSRCEKCVRTMIGLLIAKGLHRFNTFQHNEVTPKMVDNIKIQARYDYLTMPEVIQGLQSIGREDLIQAIQAQITRLPTRKAEKPKGRLHRNIQHLRRRFRLAAA